MVQKITKLLTLLTIVISIDGQAQGFGATATQWNIPNLGESFDDQLYGDNSNYSIIDFNGDGKPDLIDAEDDVTATVWIAGSQKYWKVYLNTGNSFAATAIQWNIPDLGESFDDQLSGDNSNYVVLDMNGDLKPDLVDAENNNSGSVWLAPGSQKYWKVYLNNGSGFDATAIQWNIPDLGESFDDQIYGDNGNYSVIDFNGDLKPDLVDAESNTSGNVWLAPGSQKYWKVYLNNGSGFEATGIQWNIPDLGESFDDQIYGDNSNYGVVDFNGDNKPDLIDAENNNTGSVWLAPGSQKYWKVYLNTGSGFADTAVQWNIPNLGESFDDQLYGDTSNYSIIDFDGDNKPDLIDAEDNTSAEVWLAGSQRYWKVFLNTGSGFAATGSQWNLPDLGESFHDQIYGDNSNYGVVDFDGDKKPDMIDAENNNTGSVWLAPGSQKYWKVYLNSGTGPLAVSEVLSPQQNIAWYPNPFRESVTIESASGFTNAELQVYNLSGQQVHLQKLASKQEIINLDLPAGIYLFRILDDTSEVVKLGKLIRQ